MMKKYQEIADELRRRIVEGDYAEDEMLPDQIALAEEFGVSRMTLKKAIDMIAMEGLLFRKRGVGTFVIKSALWNSGDSKVDEYAGLSKQFPNKTIKSKIITFDILFPPENVKSLLMLEDNQPVYHIERLRIIDDKPYILENTYFVANLVRDLTEDIINRSIYNHIRDTLGLKIGGAYRKIHADKSNKLDWQELICDEHTPILEVEQVVYLTNGTPFEYSTSRSRYDTRSYTITDIIKQ